MKNIFSLFARIILLILRVIFYPFRIFCNFIYGNSKPDIVGYAWYLKDEYQSLIDSFDDDIDEIITTYDLWRDRADKSIKKYSDKGCLVIKVTIEAKELKAWLRDKSFLNTLDNREKYVNFRLRQFLDDASI
ncbi:MAG: hypothetical protein PHI97_18135 [Desulfobulbus sp.]|nr:hypothetical protein [Desulfobulbus sp.]